MESLVTITTIVILAALVGGVGYRLGRRNRVGQMPASPVPASPVPAEPVALSAGGVDQRDRNHQIVQALADLRLGVVVVDETGEEIFRNRAAQAYASGRHGNALVEAAMERVVDGAGVGLSLEETVDLYGPPARNLLVQASALFDGGEPSGVVAVIEDVTQARHLDRVRSDFVANVSHELRTPVGAMSVLAEALVDSDDPTVERRLAGRIQAECLRLSETIDDLLVLSRLETGPKAEMETLDLMSVVTMALKRTAEAAIQNEVMVQVDNASGRPILVDGDPTQLTSAVANLLDNAIKYSDRGQRISIEVGTEPVATGGEAGGTGGPAFLSVTDTGIGIPERDIDRIFERFYRVDTARSRETGGTGLGLSIVRHAMLNHGGTVEVDSAEGAGSTFTLRLPVSPAHLQVEPIPSELLAGKEEAHGSGGDDRVGGRG